MSWVVKLALSRAYTFIVFALLILLAGVFSILRTPTDIFPDIRIPVISAVWTYAGLSPEDMSGRVLYAYERYLTSTVNDIEHIESTSLPGYGIVKIFFQPTVDIRTATAQVTSISQTILKFMPPGITPPLILNYNAATVPILQIALSSPTIPEQKLFDWGQNFIRPQLATVPGSAMTSPYGGKVRQIQIDLDPQAMQSKGVSPTDVSDALAAQNLIIPAGTEKIGKFEYNIKINDSPDEFEVLNNIPVKTITNHSPIKQAGTSTIFLRDVAHVRDGYPPQINIVRVDGRRAVLLTVLKNGSASTLDIISGVRGKLPLLKETLPSDLKLSPLADQSIFVKAAISGVVREAVIAALLTSLMILLFLGSWRSTLIIAASIPLAILFSIACLSALGETMNVMTLGGLALAVGILVDDATVMIENINHHLEFGKDVRTAIIDGASQIVQPAFVSTFSICIVFIPMFFLTGVSRYLFVPMAEAVVFAMIASFILSQTFVPTVANFLLKAHSEAPHASLHDQWVMDPTHRKKPFPHQIKYALAAFQRGFEARFSQVRHGYARLLQAAVNRRKVFIPAFMAVVLSSFALLPFLGRNFFPDLDSGQIKMHVRAQVGTRVEETASLFDKIEEVIRQEIPRDQLDNIVDNIGLTVSGINTAYSNTGTIGPEDGDILISLNENHSPTAGLIKRLRTVLPEKFPGTSFAFLPADIVSQILNFGAPAPIDLQIKGPNHDANLAYIGRMLRRVQHINGIADARIQQSANYPQFDVDVDRTRAQTLGVTERDVSSNLMATLSGSFQIAPTFWLNPRNGVSYPIVVQTPQYRIDSLSALENVPITVKNAKPLSSVGQAGTARDLQRMQVLGGLATITRDVTEAVVTHYAIQPSFDIYAAIQGVDLGSVANDIHQLVEKHRSEIPKGATVQVLGQVPIMEKSFTGLLLGLVASILLIYLLIVVNFQSWLDPFVIITALPSALAGIIWMLFMTHTTLSVPALTGAIMCMGVATANSILVVSFARERLHITHDSAKAAVEAGFTRFRPVLMTALAMIIGMLPMALGLGDGGEQNAPLGRAVIGGLTIATLSTLIFVPVVFSLVHAKDKFHSHHEGEDLDATGEPHAT
ncbi:MAG: efflux RND transporter permease subunit [Betaproteobacteria bacterium]|nr:efflux RND transporter permease subunit [Betaproteobacteria bacterium]MDE2622845.1 efflux RND transporter permease subunit [Betaproteobacteria bacterium]